MNRELTKARSTLRILGEGILIFTLWDVLKPFLLMLLPRAVPEATTELAAQMAAELPFQLPELSASSALLILLGVLLFLLLYLVLRLYAGFAARAEGLGRARGGGHVIAAALVLLFQTAGLLVTVWLLFRLRPKGSIWEEAASLTLEISSAAIMLEMLVTSVRYRRLRRQAGTGR